MAYVKVKVKKWIAPNFVCLDGPREGSMSLADAGPDVVHELVVEWLQDVYAKAGMTPDWRFE